jgi:NTP pyrophosphatase (non-canonical NTP hydrolase)
MEEIQKYLKEFDKAHGWDWENLSLEKKIEKLKYSIIALTGELGELAEPVKKFLRESEKTGIKKNDYENLKEQIKEELADIFIYLIKLANLLDIDLKQECFKKINKNKNRFKNFEN